MDHFNTGPRTLTVRKIYGFSTPPLGKGQRCARARPGLAAPGSPGGFREPASGEEEEGGVVPSDHLPSFTAHGGRGPGLPEAAPFLRLPSWEAPVLPRQRSLGRRPVTLLPVEPPALPRRSRPGPEDSRPGGLSEDSRCSEDMNKFYMKSNFTRVRVLVSHV